MPVILSPDWLIERGIGESRAMRIEGGEIVATRVLLDGAVPAGTVLDAKLVRAGDNGRPVTDGVFPESKEFLAGFWILNVDKPERAYEIAAKVSAAPGAKGVPLNMPIEVRPIMSGPPPEFL